MGAGFNFQEGIGGADLERFSTINMGQRGVLEQLMAQLSGFKGTPFDVAGTFPGATAGQQLSLAGLENQASGAAQEERAETAGFGRDAINKILGTEEIDFDAFFTSNVVDPLLQIMEERIAPSIKRASAGVGTAAPITEGSGGTQGTLGRANQDLITEITRARESSALGFRDQLIRQQLQALGVSPAIDAAQIGPLLQVMQGSEMFRNIDMQQFMAAMQENARQDQIRLNAMVAALGGATSPTMAGVVVPHSEALAQGFGNIASAGEMGMMAGACWGAAAHYGWYTPRWTAARNWIMVGWPSRSHLGKRFLRFYLAHGRELARLIKVNPNVRGVTRPFFDWCVASGRAL